MYPYYTFLVTLINMCLIAIYFYYYICTSNLFVEINTDAAKYQLNVKNVSYENLSVGTMDDVYFGQYEGLIKTSLIGGLFMNVGLFVITTYTSIFSFITCSKVTDTNKPSRINICYIIIGIQLIYGSMLYVFIYNGSLKYGYLQLPSIYDNYTLDGTFVNTYDKEFNEGKIIYNGIIKSDNCIVSYANNRTKSICDIEKGSLINGKELSYFDDKFYEYNAWFVSGNGGSVIGAVLSLYSDYLITLCIKSRSNNMNYLDV